MGKYSKDPVNASKCMYRLFDLGHLYYSINLTNQTFFSLYSYHNVIINSLPSKRLQHPCALQGKNPGDSGTTLSNSIITVQLLTHVYILQF